MTQGQPSWVSFRLHYFTEGRLMCESVSVIMGSTTHTHSHINSHKHPQTQHDVTNVQCFFPFSKVGLLFDVDGVLIRGGSVIPAAKRAFQKLLDQEKKSFRLPVVFVTNAGSCNRQHKAQQLSQLLEVEVRPTLWPNMMFYLHFSQHAFLFCFLF